MKYFWQDPHMVQTGKSLIKALYITCAIFFIFFVIFHIAVALYASFLSDKQTRAFEGGIAADKLYLKTQGEEVAQNNSLIQKLLSGDSVGLLTILQQEKTVRDVGSIGVANAQGVSIGRTKDLGIHGDNVFLAIPEGRMLARGLSVQNIGQSTIDPNQIRMTAAQPIMYESHMIGGIFVNYSMDDMYAVRFRNKYLLNGSEVLFYTKQSGVFGDSFSDEKTRSLINSYFNSGSEWIKDGISGKTISFEDGTSYLVLNFVFPGLEQSTGGALVFIPRRDISTIANILTAFFTLLVFLFYALREHRGVKSQERGWHYYTLLFAVSLPVFTLTFFALHAQNIGRLRLTHIPYTLYNSTIRLQPEWGIYSEDFEESFSITVDTGDESINAVAVGLTFDPQAIEVKSLDTASSTCSYVIENVVDQKAGKAHFSCAILNSGVGQRSLPVFSVIVVPKRIGTFNLSFDPKETQVLANDGLGTNVLRISQGGSYQVDKFSQSLFTDISSTTPGRSFIVFSSTHPNQSRWYNASTTHFVWQGKPNVVYRYAFDISPDTIPSSDHTTQDTSINLPVPGDGIFYFHLQLASGGPIAHYRIQSDQTPPTILAMNLSEPKIIAGDVVRFSFEAEDKASGVQHNYYVDLGNHLFLPVGSQLFVPFLEVGDQKITLRVYDTAGNYSEKSQTIHVEDK